MKMMKQNEYTYLGAALLGALLLTCARQVSSQAPDQSDQYDAASSQDIVRIGTLANRVPVFAGRAVPASPPPPVAPSSRLVLSPEPPRQRVTLAVRPLRARDPLLHGPEATKPVATPTPTSALVKSEQPSLVQPVPESHAALMAQVAAERAAEIGDQPQPSNSQLQAPPTLRQPASDASGLQVASLAPSFEQVRSRGCPVEGVFSYENRDHCDRYYLCTNGTFTEEACPNGLAYSKTGAVYQHCAYNFNVDCGLKKTAAPIASAGCPWQFGVFPVDSIAPTCSIDYSVCEWGVPERKRCSPEGLFYDDRIKGCQWADQLGCKSESLLNFKCPEGDQGNVFWPYPRYYHTDRDVIVCVNEQPRLVQCEEDQLVDAQALTCIDVKPKKKKHNRLQASG